jgi:hypothetical protein
MRIPRTLALVVALPCATILSCAKEGNNGFPYDGGGSDGGAGFEPDARSDRNLVGDGYSSGPCVGLECNVVDCVDQGLPDTTITGKVYDPAGKNPLYNVIVYIPNAPVERFKSGVTCDQCGTLASGSPIVTALTGPDGRFVLDNVPVGDNIPLVIQLGKWRRQLVVPHVQACVDTLMTAPNQMRLPANKNEGDMPQMAVSTGGCDPFECLLRKIGIDQSEFTSETGDGRVHIYQGAAGANLQGQTVSPATALWGGKKLPNYDLVVNACECSEAETEKPQSSIDNLVAYANTGGRIFNTHYHYYWIDPTKLSQSTSSNPAWQTTAAFIPEVPGAASINGYVDMTFPKGEAFAKWLLDVGASPVPGEFPVDQARYNVTSVNAPSTQWVYNSNSGQTQTMQPALLHYTFNTPVGLPDDKQCGKVLFSDFHVVSQLAGSSTFPEECDSQDMTPQEKALEFMLFDLSSCIQKETDPPKPPPPR